jgi:hypothetical protein
LRSGSRRRRGARRAVPRGEAAEADEADEAAEAAEADAACAVT